MNQRILLFSCLLIAVLGCLKPPLAISKKEKTFWVNTATLGEYPAAVSRIRVFDSDSRRLLWELRSVNGDIPQIWGFELKLGENPASLPDSLGGKYQVILPKSEAVFVLRSRVNYLVEVCNESTRCAREPIVFNAKDVQK